MFYEGGPQISWYQLVRPSHRRSSLLPPEVPPLTLPSSPADALPLVRRVVPVDRLQHVHQRDGQARDDRLALDPRRHRDVQRASLFLLLPPGPSRSHELTPYSSRAQALNSLAENESLLTLPPWSNLYLCGAVALSMALHFAILYVPVLQTLFQVMPLNVAEWKAVVFISFPVILIDEVLKLVTNTVISPPAKLKQE